MCRAAKLSGIVGDTSFSASKMERGIEMLVTDSKGLVIIRTGLG